MSGAPIDALRVAQEILLQEARLLDARDWSGWLALYHEDAVYWVPSWRDEDHEIENPDREVSLIYHTNRLGLEERVMRVRSRQSVTALPLPRTTHLVSNLEILGVSARRIEACAAWTVHFYHPRTTEQGTHHGRCVFVLTEAEGRWRYAHKRISLMNDCVNAVLDFYLL